MHESKMTLVIHRDQIMIVLVHLDRGQLAFVDDVLVAQRTQIKPIVQPDGVGGALPQDIQLAFKAFLVEALGVGDFGLICISVGRPEHYKRLHDQWLPRQGRRSQQTRISRHLPPSQDAEIQRFGNVLKGGRRLLEHLGVRLEKEIPCSVLTLRRQLVPRLSFEILDEKSMRHRGHHARTVPISRVGAHRTTMGHIAEQVACYRVITLEPGRRRGGGESNYHR